MSSHAYNANSKTVDLDTACNSTLYVDYCKLVLKPNASLTIHDYSRISVGKSLFAARKFLQLVDSHLKNHPFITTVKPSKIVRSTTNVDFLLESSVTINTTDTLSLVAIDRCTDLAHVKNDLYPSLTNGTNLYSISLALFIDGWKVGRKLIQAILGQALVYQTVVVSQDGSGDFTTISDAIAAAPNNTKGRNGYFQIHVVKGVYQEYMVYINQTVITSNRSLGGGSTTFNFATLG
ncbi:hypothetical protein NE237_009535 [Protea cynaroides]|uniref:Pectinesterase catalytic domain-containing protein n=1 Tax=Protea cynaroides TaxID=273540 RepID=A0A9Q0KY11_9MAGN|nr:hypothetical protein NE237_009535 [Protea cynaroides]